MEFRDILFIDNLDQPQSMKEYEDDDFKNIISYLGEDFLNKYTWFIIHFLFFIFLLFTGKWNFSIGF